jgi:hypothetical protein
VRGADLLEVRARLQHRIRKHCDPTRQLTVDSSDLPVTESGVVSAVFSSESLSVSWNDIHAKQVVADIGTGDRDHALLQQRFQLCKHLLFPSGLWFGSESPLEMKTATPISQRGHSY